MTTDIRRALASLAVVAATTMPVAAQAECSPSELNTASNHYQTAYVLAQGGQWADTVKPLEDAIAACPDHWQSVELLASAQMRIKDYAASGDNYARLIEGNYDGVYARVEQRILSPYGFVLLKNRNWEEAENIYEAILTHDPANKEAHERLVYAYNQSGDNPKVVEHLEALYAMSTGEEQAKVASRIGKTYEKMGDTIAAKEWYGLGGGGASGQFKLALDHFNNKEWAEAAESFEAFLEGKPNSAPAWKNLGQTYQQLGRLQDAVNAYKKALALRPDRHDVTSSLGFVYSDLSQWDAAEALAKDALANWSDDVSQKDSMYFLMGKVLEKRDANYEEAIRMFEEAKDDPYWGALAVREIDRQQQLIQIRNMKADQSG